MGPLSKKEYRLDLEKSLLTFNKEAANEMQVQNFMNGYHEAMREIESGKVLEIPIKE